MARLYAPNGTPIIGTLELVPGIAAISNPLQDGAGKFRFDFAGGTDMLWDAQVTVERQGQRVFSDEDGDQWLESELILREDEDE